MKTVISRHNKKTVKKEKEKFARWKIPVWLDCTWRRVPCGRESCPVCGKIKAEREKHLARGENPHDIKIIFADLSRDFGKIIRTIEREARKMGIKIKNIEKIQQPPLPEQFFLMHQVEKWRESVHNLVENDRNAGRTWVMLEAADDLIWYANLLPAKSYRQLCNRWHLNQQDEYGEYDYAYTKYVLDEIFKILNGSILQILPYNPNLLIAKSELAMLKKYINKI